MSQTLARQLQVLRDEALNCSELGEDAPGGEIFDTIVHRVEGQRDEIDLSLHEALSRRIAWGENEGTIIADSDAICRRLIAAIHRSFSQPEDVSMLIAIVTDVSCAACRHIAITAAQRTGRQRARQRRESMVHGQLKTAIEQQESLLREKS